MPANTSAIPEKQVSRRTSPALTQRRKRSLQVRSPLASGTRSTRTCRLLVLSLLSLSTLWLFGKSTRTPRTARHAVADGFLHANLDARTHPVEQLIQDAESHWDDLLRRQSRTLDAAVTEYQRRYRRRPPKNFELWYVPFDGRKISQEFRRYTFATENNVKLLDEYDQIDDDLRIFYGMSPDMYRTRAAEGPLLNKINTWTWRIQGGRIIDSFPSTSLPAPSQRHLTSFKFEQLYLLPLLPFLPDLNVTVQLDDLPHQSPTHRLRSRLIQHADREDYISVDDAALLLDAEDLQRPVYVSTCSPSSPGAMAELRRFRAGLDLFVGRDFDQTQSGTFVKDMLVAMDPCRHPEMIGWHASAIVPSRPRNVIQPWLAQSKLGISGDIVFPYTSQFEVSVGKDPLWEEKPFHKMAWRGSTTGQAMSSDDEIELSLRTQRMRLVNKVRRSTAQTSLLDIDKHHRLLVHNASTMLLNELFTDCAFVETVQCGEEQTCQTLASSTFVDRRRQTKDELNKYRYLLDMDGNAFSGRFRRLLLSNSAVIKSSAMIEWNSKRMLPWVHYIPLSNSFAELYNILVFFEGLPSAGIVGHEELARRIAYAGKEWTQMSWREVDMQAYVFRLLLEIGRLSADDREAMSYAA